MEIRESTQSTYSHPMNLSTERCYEGLKEDPDFLSFWVKIHIHYYVNICQIFKGNY